MTDKSKRPRYRVLIGINYPPNDKRAEPGDVIDDIPPSSIPWLVRDRIIEPVAAAEAPEAPVKGG